MDASVADFYRDKTIFITGASGFIGKVLLEKLLYSCSGLKKVYVLMRSKRGKSIKTRVNDIWESYAFERLRKTQPDALKKIIPVEGDLISDNLGVNPLILNQLYSEVNIVFHCAATLKLEANLRDAIDMNTTGTWRLIKICREMKNLECMMHLSTAFCYADFEVLDEKVHDATEDPHEVMHMMTWMKDDALQAIEKKMLSFHPNTYTYSKRLTECLIRNEYNNNMPVAIARPSIVIPAWREPVEGWVDSLNGPIGVMIGAGKGVIRTMHCDGDCKVEIITVDYTINALIVFAANVGTMKEKSPEIPVCNMSCGDLRNVTWNTVLTLSKETVKEYPLDYPLWYPDGNIHKNETIHKLSVFFFHLIPAYFIDFLMLIFRQKRFMVRLQSRISFGLKLLQFFTTRNWFFKIDKYKKLMNSLSDEDSVVFPLDFSLVEDKEYMKRCILGGRLYCLKEKPEDIPKARRVNFMMYLLDRFITVLFYGYIIWTIYYYSEPVRKLWQSSPNLTSTNVI